MANTRSKRVPTEPRTSGTAKRRCGRAAHLRKTAASNDAEDSTREGVSTITASTSQEQSAPGRSSNPTGQSQIPPTRHPHNLDFSDLTLANYEGAMPHWPMNRINKVIASQTAENEKLPVVVFAHAQAVLERFEHTLHMLAMIARCSVAVLKRRLGLAGGTHAENTWHRWLSFSIEAQKHPMPTRGDPNADSILTFRNKANAAAYQRLSDDEYSCYTAPIFYALGGYPNYSAINITDLENINLDDVLVPEVPQLTEVQEARYRPLYLKSVDAKKVAKDKDFNTPAASASAIEKRSLQCFKKIATQLARDSPLVGLDYLFIACSKSPLGQGWCRVKTTQKEMFAWLNNQVNFEQLFPIYAQGGGTFAEINKSITDGKVSEANQSRAKKKREQRCDTVKGELTARIHADLIKVHGELPSGWPRGEFSQEALVARKIHVYIRRDPVLSSLSDDLWNKGYDKMGTAGRSAWLADYKAGHFELMPPQAAPQPQRLGSETSTIGPGTSGPALPASEEAGGLTRASGSGTAGTSAGGDGELGSGTGVSNAGGVDLEHGVIGEWV